MKLWRVNYHHDAKTEQCLVVGEHISQVIDKLQAYWDEPGLSDPAHINDIESIFCEGVVI